MTVVLLIDIGKKNILISDFEKTNWHNFFRDIDKYYNLFNNVLRLTYSLVTVNFCYSVTILTYFSFTLPILFCYSVIFG